MPHRRALIRRPSCQLRRQACHRHLHLSNLYEYRMEHARRQTCSPSQTLELANVLRKPMESRQHNRTRTAQMLAVAVDRMAAQRSGTKPGSKRKIVQLLVARTRLTTFMLMNASVSSCPQRLLALALDCNAHQGMNTFLTRLHASLLQNCWAGTGRSCHHFKWRTDLRVATRRTHHHRSSSTSIQIQRARVLEARRSASLPPRPQNHRHVMP